MKGGNNECVMTRVVETARQHVPSLTRRGPKHNPKPTFQNLVQCQTQRIHVSLYKQIPGQGQGKEAQSDSYSNRQTMTGRYDKNVGHYILTFCVELTGQA